MTKHGRGNEFRERIDCRSKNPDCTLYFVITTCQLCACGYEADCVAGIKGSTNDEVLSTVREMSFGNVLIAKAKIRIVLCTL
jgi:hypothetical protein